MLTERSSRPKLLQMIPVAQGTSHRWTVEGNTGHEPPVVNLTGHIEPVVLHAF